MQKIIWLRIFCGRDLFFHIKAQCRNECILVVINLIVSGEHRVYFNTNVCSRFCCTPRPFQAYGYPSLLPYMGGLVFILVFRQECVPNAAVYSKLSILWHYSIGSSFSPHTRHYILFSDFSLSPVFTAEDFGIAALLRDRLLARSLLRLLIILRPDTPLFLTGEWNGVFFGAFCALLLSWYLLTVGFRP